MALGNLKVTLTLAADQFVSGIKTVQQEFEGLGKTIMSPSFQQGVAAVGAGMVAAGTALGGSLLAATRSAANYGDAMFELSQKTGISGAALGGYKLLADQSGTSIEGLARGLNILQKNMVAAATGSGEQAKVFKALGISVKDSEGNIRDLSDVMPQIAERFKGMEDGALQTALANKLMGRSGAELIPFFNEGPDAMREMAEEAERMGLATTKAEEAMSDKFNDTLAKSSLAVQGLSNAIGFALIPSLTSLVEKGNEWIIVAQQWVRENPGITQGLAAVSALLVGGGGLLLGLTGVAAILPSVTAGFAQMGIASTAGLGAAVGAVGLYTAAVVGFVAQLWAAYDVGKTLRETGTIGTDVWSAAKVSLAGANPLGTAYMLGQTLRGPEGPPRIMPGGLTPEAEAAFQAGRPTDNSDAELRKLLADLEKKSKAAEIDRFNESVKSLMASLTGTTQPAAELVAAIKKLDAAGLMTSEVILALGKDFDTLKNSKDPVIQQYVRMIPLIEMAANAHKMEAENIKAIEEATKSRPPFDPSILQMPDLSYPGQPLPEGDIRGGLIRKRADEAIKSLEDQRQEMIDLGDTIAQLNADGLSAIQIEDALGISLERVADRARELNVEMPDIVDSLGRSAELSKSWGDSLASISDQLVDMIVDFDFSFKRLGDIAKDTAKSMATSFLDGLFKPFKEGLKGLGEDAGTWAAGLLFGGKSNAGGEGGGLLGSIFGGGGGILGGLFGGKVGGGAAGTPPFVPGGSGVGIGGMGGGLLASLGGIGGIASGVGVVADIIKGGWKPGQKEQNKGTALFRSFFDQVVKIRESGLSATNQLKMIGNVYDSIMPAAQSYSGASALISKAFTDQQLYLQPLADQESNSGMAVVSPLVSEMNRDLASGSALDAAGEGTGGGGDTYYEININVDHVENYDDFIAKIDSNHHGGAEIITRKVIKMTPAIVST